MFCYVKKETFYFSLFPMRVRLPHLYKFSSWSRRFNLRPFIEEIVGFLWISLPRILTLNSLGIPFWSKEYFLTPIIPLVSTPKET